jgi:hypothetical protein
MARDHDLEWVRMEFVAAQRTWQGGGPLPAERDNGRRCSFAPLRIEAHVAMSDAAVAFHMGRLDDNEPGT